MRKGLRGNYQPENEEDFKRLQWAGHLRFTECVSCHEEFSEGNTASPAGWVETQISGMCEDCFDALYEDDDEEEDE